MLFIQFATNLHSGKNLVKYRDVNDDNYYYMYLDIETLNLLINNFGIISTYKVPARVTYCDTPRTGRDISLKYCGADILIGCGNNANFNVLLLEQYY